MALIDFAALGFYHKVCLLFAAGMLLWDTVEVGRNDAANLVNAVFGARVMPRRWAVAVAGIAVVAGASLSSAVIETARKGIFDPTSIDFGNQVDTLNAVLAIYVSVYVVDTVLLYGYSAFGMPVSTTACLVFELLGASFFVYSASVQWGKAGVVLAGIVCSILLTGIVAFFVQRAARGAIRDRTTHLPTLLLHGGWVGGSIAAGLCYFLVMKGMKNVELVKKLKAFVDQYEAGTLIMVILLWGFFAIVIHGLLIMFRKRAAKLLFPILAVLGMMAMSFAFGQNDLANCASPGLAAYQNLEHQDVGIATEVEISRWLLFGCGLLLVAGMTTQNAERVTKAAIATGSMGDHVKLWAPRWCLNLAARILRFQGREPSLAPRQTISPAGKRMHYDTLRASTIMAVSACVIATASSLGLPVSTTYVAFAAVVATGAADRIYQRGDAELKMGRAIWVVTSWVLAAGIAALAAGIVATIILWTKTPGIMLCLAANLVVRQYLKKRADAHAKRVAEEAYEREHPELFALEDERA